MTTPEQRLREHLDALPPLAPPPALGERIGRIHRRRVRRRRAGALAAVLVVACIAILPPLLRAPIPAATQAVSTAPPAQDILADVRALDHALQTAYERNASDAELAPLWAARARLLDPATHPAGI